MSARPPLIPAESRHCIPLSDDTATTFSKYVTRHSYTWFYFILQVIFFLLAKQIVQKACYNPCLSYKGLQKI